MPGKQGWKLQTDSTLLVSRIFKERSFPSGNYLNYVWVTTPVMYGATSSVHSLLFGVVRGGVLVQVTLLQFLMNHGCKVVIVLMAIYLRIIFCDTIWFVVWWTRETNNRIHIQFIIFSVQIRWMIFFRLRWFLMFRWIAYFGKEIKMGFIRWRVHTNCVWRN